MNKTSNLVFLWCLALSALLHLWVLTSEGLARLLSALPSNARDTAVALDRTVELDLEAAAEPTPEPEPKKPSERKTFVETPEGPDEEDPEDAELIGARSMRAKDRFEGDLPANDRPHMEGAVKDMAAAVFGDNAPALGQAGQPGEPGDATWVEEAAPAPAPSQPAAAGGGLKGTDESGPQAAAEPVADAAVDAPAAPPAQPPKPPDAPQEAKLASPQPLQVEGGRQGAVVLDEAASNAGKTGEESFNIKRHAYAPYYGHILERIGLSWQILGASEYLLDFRVAEGHKVVVEFEVLRSGEIRGLKLTHDSGNLMLSARVLACVRAASPINKFPGYVTEEKLQIRFTFLF